MLAAPTIAAHGTQEQIDLYVRDIVTGQKAWCQLFSEPGAGSDLAGLQTKGIKDGEEWVFTGQKVWTSGGQVADLGMLIARTDPDVPKHQGITYFALDMHQQGKVEIRPLVEMTGHAMFNEVFMEEATAPDSALIGGLNNGWAVANTTLMNERASLGSGGGHAAASAATPGTVAKDLGKRVGDFVDGGGAATRRWRRWRHVRRLLQAPRRAGQGQRQDRRPDRAPGPHAAAHAERARSLQQPPGQGRQGGRSAGHPGPAEHLQALDERDRPFAARRRPRHPRSLRHAPRLQAGEARTRSTTPPATRSRRMVTGMSLFAQAPPIYGGTDQVQKNIIGERVLGLPKEANNDKTAAFKDLPKNA